MISMKREIESQRLVVLARKPEAVGDLGGSDSRNAASEVKIEAIVSMADRQSVWVLEPEQSLPERKKSSTLVDIPANRDLAFDVSSDNADIILVSALREEMICSHTA
jgi:hypothetical protein